jgi:hypothetical protein
LEPRLQTSKAEIKVKVMQEIGVMVKGGSQPFG